MPAALRLCLDIFEGLTFDGLFDIHERNSQSADVMRLCPALVEIRRICNPSEKVSLKFSLIVDNFSRV